MDFFKKYIINLHEFIYKKIYCRVGPLLIIFILHFYPQMLGGFRGVIKKRFAFIEARDKLQKTNNPFDDFHVYTEGINNFEEINIVMRGGSFNKYMEEMDHSLPTFYVNFFEGFDSHNDGLNSNKFHITGDRNVFNKLMLTDSGPVILIAGDNGIHDFYRGNYKKNTKYIDYNIGSNITVVHNSKTQRIQLGSGLMSVVALYKISTKINIYGWDLYFNEDIESMSYWGILLSLLNRPEKYKCILPLVSEKIINLIYISRIINVKNITIRSFLSNIQKHGALLEKIERAVYRVRK